ncbi:hypothetical protein [Pseudobutyrivibrio ruminis]|uniref:hypothetical protein n=1 Tax=Pseudobutyrivibrio ruminis TaxID=46206 RepID=UPI0003FFA67B|nr:hypothetical protein [Pseudobutyrivibrio ruminis]
MKKFLSKVLTLALVCAIVVTGTSITSEAKGKSPAKTFIDTVVASDGLTVNGQKLTTNQIEAMLKTNDPSLKTVSGYVDTASGVQEFYDEYFDPESYYRHSQISGYVDGMYYQEDIYNDNPYSEDFLQALQNNSIHMDSADGLDMYTATLDNVGNCNTMANIWDSAKGYYTADLVANNVNASTLATYMQSNNMMSALDIYNYLVANGVKFTDDSWNTYSNGDQTQVGVIATVNGYNIRFKTMVQTAYAMDGVVTTGGEYVNGDRVTVYEDGGSKFVEQHNTYIPETVVGYLNERQAKVTNTDISIQNAKTYEWLGAVQTITDVDGKVTTYLSEF